MFLRNIAFQGDGKTATGTEAPTDKEGRDELHPMVDLMMRMVRALFDDGYTDELDLINDSAQDCRQ
ncbi:MAG: hypothetical protein V3R65_01240 [Acidiferrobacterales bacterium]